MYVNILSRMMNDTTDPDMKVSISHTRSRLETLKKNHFPNTGTLKAHLQDLWAIAVSGPDTTGNLLSWSQKKTTDRYH